MLLAIVSLRGTKPSTPCILVYTWFFLTNEFAVSYALEISNLKKTYDNGFEALKGIDLIVEKGDFFALLGPNGAGKSTTIGILCSLVNKSSGSVKVMGYDIDSDFGMAKRRLGVLCLKNSILINLRRLRISLLIPLDITVFRVLRQRLESNIT